MSAGSPIDDISTQQVGFIPHKGSWWIRYENSPPIMSILGPRNYTDLHVIHIVLRWIVTRWHYLQPLSRLHFSAWNGWATPHFLFIIGLTGLYQVFQSSFSLKENFVFQELIFGHQTWIHKASCHNETHKSFHRWYFVLQSEICQGRALLVNMLFSFSSFTIRGANHTFFIWQIHFFNNHTSS